MSQAERAKAEGILREQANDKYNEEIKKSIAEEEIPLTETTYNFESVKQKNIDRYDYYTKSVSVASFTNQNSSFITNQSGISFSWLSLITIPPIP